MTPFTSGPKLCQKSLDVRANLVDEDVRRVNRSYDEGKMVVVGSDDADKMFIREVGAGMEMEDIRKKMHQVMKDEVSKNPKVAEDSELKKFVNDPKSDDYTESSRNMRARLEDSVSLKAKNKIKGQDGVKKAYYDELGEFFERQMKGASPQKKKSLLGYMDAYDADSSSKLGQLKGMKTPTVTPDPVVEPPTRQVRPQQPQVTQEAPPRQVRPQPRPQENQTPPPPPKPIETEDNPQIRPISDTGGDPKKTTQPSGVDNVIQKAGMGIGAGGLLMSLATLILDLVLSIKRGQPDYTSFIIGFAAWCIGAFIANPIFRAAMNGLQIVISALLMVTMLQSIGELTKRRRIIAKIRDYYESLTGGGEVRSFKGVPKTSLNSIFKNLFGIKTATAVNDDTCFKFCVGKRGQFDFSCQCRKTRGCLRFPKTKFPKVFKKSLFKAMGKNSRGQKQVANYQKLGKYLNKSFIPNMGKTDLKFFNRYQQAMSFNLPIKKAIKEVKKGKSSVDYDLFNDMLNRQVMFVPKGELMKTSAVVEKEFQDEMDKRNTNSPMKKKINVGEYTDLMGFVDDQGIHGRDKSLFEVITQKIRLKYAEEFR